MNPSDMPCRRSSASRRRHSAARLPSASIRARATRCSANDAHQVAVRGWRLEQAAAFEQPDPPFGLARIEVAQRLQRLGAGHIAGRNSRPSSRAAITVASRRSRSIIASLPARSTATPFIGAGSKRSLNKIHVNGLGGAGIESQAPVITLGVAGISLIPPTGR